MLTSWADWPVPLCGKDMWEFTGHTLDLDKPGLISSLPLPNWMSTDRLPAFADLLTLGSGKQ